MLIFVLLIWGVVATAMFFAIQKLLEYYPNLPDQLIAVARSLTNSIWDAYEQAQVAAASRKSGDHVAAPSVAVVEEPLISSVVMEPDLGFGNPVGVATSYGNQAHVASGTSRANSQISPQSSTEHYDNSALWTNELLVWLFRYYQAVPDFIHQWIRAMNEAAKKAANTIGCEVSYEDVGIEDGEVPQFESIRAEQGPRDHLTLRGTIDCPVLNLRLVSTQRHTEGLRVTNYDARLLHLRGEVQGRIASIANELFVMCCFDGRPQLELELYSNDPSHEGDCVDPVLVDETIRKCLMTAVTNISLTASKDLSQPVEELLRRLNSSQMMMKNDEFVFAKPKVDDNVVGYQPSASVFHAVPDLYPPGPTESPTLADGEEVDEELLLDVEVEPGRSSPVIVVDSSLVRTVPTIEEVPPSTPPPIYSEVVMIDDVTVATESTEQPVTPSGSSLTAPAPRLSERAHSRESYASTHSVRTQRMLVKLIRAHKLGDGEAVSQPFGTVELDEPAQKHTTSLGLNLSPYWDEHFLFDLNESSEELLIELYDRVDGSNAKFLGLAIVSIEEVKKATSQVHVLTLQSRPYTTDRVSGTITTEFNFIEPMTIGKEIEMFRESLRDGDGVMTTSVSQSRVPLNGAKDITVTPLKTSTVTVKSVELGLPNDSGYASSQMGSQSHVTNNGHDKDTPAITTVTNTTQYEHLVQKAKKERGRAREQRRDRETTRKERPSSLFGGLRERLSLRRSQSASRLKQKEKVNKRGVSLDRQGQSQLPVVDADDDLATYHPPRGAVSTPPSRDTSLNRIGFRFRGDGYQSDGDASVGSTDSVYNHSTLVVELEEEGHKKFYLIPPAMIGKPDAKRIMKRGQKLHIFNEHSFAAVRLSKSSPCNVCTRMISARGFGKQAYHCKDCQTVTHKRCHWKIDSTCPCSTVAGMQMEYLMVR